VERERRRVRERQEDHTIIEVSKSKIGRVAQQAGVSRASAAVQVQV
jgi:hypothetical protein